MLSQPGRLTSRSEFFYRVLLKHLLARMSYIRLPSSVESLSPDSFGFFGSGYCRGGGIRSHAKRAVKPSFVLRVRKG